MAGSYSRAGELLGLAKQHDPPGVDLERDNQPDLSTLKC
jgi:hypothetical protein